MIDIVNELNAIRRSTGEGRLPAGEARTVTLRREYDAPVEDVWDAITDPDRIGRWFLPVTGDLRLGGTYQLKGNAGGEIRRCEPPRLLQVTWVMGPPPGEEDNSLVEVKLSPGAAGHTVLELEHIAVVPPDMWEQFGPGAVGVGWELALVGLAMHLSTEDGASIPEDEREAWAQSDEARALMKGSSAAWGVALEATGAPSADVARMVENTTNFYAPPPDGSGDSGEAEGSSAT
jgi:uncharacterized protein YndB with AHSA1/START domain